MQRYTAVVRNGRLTLDVPTDLPEGREVVLLVADFSDDRDDEEFHRADREMTPALLACLRRGIAGVKAGRVVNAEEVIAELEATASEAAERDAASTHLPEPFRVRVVDGRVHFRTRAFGTGEALLIPTSCDDERIAAAWEAMLEEAEREGYVDAREAIARLSEEAGLGSAEETPPPAFSQFDRWVGANNISEDFEYAKGWWEYVELVRNFAFKHEIKDVRVVGHYTVSTPEEELPMPVVAFVRADATVTVRWDFEAYPHRWTVSVQRRSAYRGPLFGLFDVSVDVRTKTVSGMTPDLVFGPYRANQSTFTCELRDEWDVSTLMRLMFFEP